MKQQRPIHGIWSKSKYPSGTRIEGKVKSLTDFGAFIGLEEGIDGLIHISDMSWTKHIKHPSELFKKGQKVDAVVMKIDKEKERLSWATNSCRAIHGKMQIPTTFPVGYTATGKMSKIADFGVFIELEGDVEGLIHISELALDASTKLEDRFKIGEDVPPKSSRWTVTNERLR